MIYDRLRSNQNDVKHRTQEHLNVSESSFMLKAKRKLPKFINLTRSKLQKFAGEGLRTLVLAEKVIDEIFFNRWRRKQQEAAVAPNDRDDKLEAIYEEIESDLRLVGVTAIEDKLQDGVPETIANLQTAGIKIWVLTGDKQETAINIGYSCQLLTDEMADVFIVDGVTKPEVEQQLRKFKESIKIVNTFHPPGVKPINANGFFKRDPSVDIKIQTPPAISIVTFRWDDEYFERTIIDEVESEQILSCS